MSEAVLQVTNLVKKIKGKTILDHISFEVGQGDCLALIGPNGAGKTTLMSCILGDKKASSGQVFIKGKKGKAQDQIAVLLQENTIPSQLKVKELIAFFQDISENGLSESSIMKLATSPCLKIFVLLSFSKPVISFDNRLETIRLSSQG